jgi:hypothetical protein
LANVVLIPTWVRKDHFLEVAYVLRDAGHDVTYASFLDIESAVTAHDFRFVRLESVSGALRDAPSLNSLPGQLGRAQRWFTRWFVRRSRRDEQAIRQGLNTLVDKFSEFDPGLFLIDMELPGHVFAALGGHKRVALVSTLLSPWKRPGLPPQHRNLAPPVGDNTASKRFEIAWLRLYIWKRWRQTVDYLRQAGADRTAMLRQFAARNGLNWHEIVDPWQWPLPFSYRKLPVITLNALELDFPHEPHPDARFVGPVMCRRRISNPDMDPEQQVRLDALVQRCRSDEHKRLIYCSFGRFADSYEQGLLLRLISACQQRPEWTLLVALGDSDLPPAFDKLPENAHTFGWLPQLRVLKEVDCAIIHAGISSINECIYQEVPMVLYPLRLNDQQGNAARVAWHGLGICANRETDTAEDMIQHIDQAMNSESIRTRLTEMRMQFNRYVDDESLLTAVNAAMRAPEIKGLSS